MAEAAVDTSGNGLSGVLPDETPIQDDTVDVVDEVVEVGGEPVAKPSDEDQEQAQAEEPKAQDAEPVKKPAESKETRYIRQLQSERDQLIARVAPHAQRIAEWEAEQAKKEAEIMGSREKALTELANNPIETIRMAARAELQAYQQAQSAHVMQAEWQKASTELSEYAEGRGIDNDTLGAMLQPYNGFSGQHPTRALELAKLLVDKHAEPQVNIERVANATKEADKMAKEKLTKRTPNAMPGASASTPAKSKDDQFWEAMDALKGKKVVSMFGK